jgi:hypothetical protein
MYHQDVSNTIDDMSVWIGYHIVTNAAGEPATYTWVGDSEEWSGGIAAFRNVDTLSIFDCSPLMAFSENLADPICEDIRTRTDNSMLVMFAAASLCDTGTVIVPPNSTQLWFRKASNATTHWNASMASYDLAVKKGYQGLKLFDVTDVDASDQYKVIMALRPRQLPYDFMLGDSTAPNSNFFFGQGDHLVFDTAATQYTAIGGEIIQKVILYFHPGDGDAPAVNMQVGLYEWDPVKDTATARVALDTIYGTQTVAGAKDTVNVNWGLTAGKTYTIAYATISSEGALIGNNTTRFASGNEVQNRRTTDAPGAYLADPYPWSGMTSDYASPQFYALGIHTGGGSVVLQGNGSDSTSTDDSFISGRLNNGDDTTNFGGLTSAQLARDSGPGDTMRTIIKFPNLHQTTFGGAEDIDSAVLELRQYTGDNVVDSVKTKMYRVTSRWEEGTGAGADNEDWVSWKYRADSCYEAAATARCSTRAPDTLWTTKGGDYNSTLLDSAWVDSTETDHWVSWTVPKAVCSTWYATPTANHGVLLISDVAVNHVRYVYSSERTGTTEDPRLTIYWTPRDPQLIASGTKNLLDPSIIIDGRASSKMLGVR